MKKRDARLQMRVDNSFMRDLKIASKKINNTMTSLVINAVRNEMKIILGKGNKHD